MISNKFIYTPDVDKKMVSALGELFSTKVNSSQRIAEGEFNYVYLVSTSEKKFIVRVFSHESFPSEDKLKWINTQFKSHQVPHAELLYYTRDNKYFPFGFMVSEFIEGRNAIELIKNGEISIADFHKKLGMLLKKVHSIELDKYGSIQNGDGINESVTNYYLSETENASLPLGEDPEIRNLYKSAIDQIKKLMSPYEKTFTPVLVHKDATPDNCIVTPEGVLVLVDWDSAISSIWVADYAIITYSGSHLSALGDLEERQKIIRESFLEGYGNIEYTRSELNDIERAMFIIRACELLPYYFHFQQNSKAYLTTLTRLKSLISN